MRFLLIVTLLLCLAQSAVAAVDIVQRGHQPVRIEDVYQQQGAAYVALDDVLPAVGLSGYWDSIAHSYKIKSPRGQVIVSPASDYMDIDGMFYLLDGPPRFIDGRLRISDNFIVNQLSMLTGRSIIFRNLDPVEEPLSEAPQSDLDSLFTFLLDKNTRTSNVLRAVAIDAGHGGLDTGVLAPGGEKEKDLNLTMANKLARLLKMRLGIPLYLSRDGDYEVTPEQRIKTASQDDVDIWLLLHAQASFSPDAHGVTLLIRDQQTQSQAVKAGREQTNESLLLARELAAALKQEGIMVNAIIPTDRLALGQGTLPTVQVEMGYLSHPQEKQQLYDEAYQNRLIQSLYNGIRNYAHIEKENSDVIN